jgi:hypothetical protein
VTITNQNFVGIAIADIPVDLEYVRCNFSQPQPVNNGGLRRGQRLFVGDDTPRTFTNCNMVNCEPPPGSTLNSCQTHMIERNIETTADTIQVDGGPILTEQHHSNFAYGRYLPATETYEDFPGPREEVED